MLSVAATWIHVYDLEEVVSRWRFHAPYCPVSGSGPHRSRKLQRREDRGNALSSQARSHPCVSELRAGGSLTRGAGAAKSAAQGRFSDTKGAAGPPPDSHRGHRATRVDDHNDTSRSACRAHCSTCQHANSLGEQPRAATGKDRHGYSGEQRTIPRHRHRGGSAPGGKPHNRESRGRQVRRRPWARARYRRRPSTRLSLKSFPSPNNPLRHYTCAITVLEISPLPTVRTTPP